MCGTCMYIRMRAYCSTEAQPVPDSMHAYAHAQCSGCPPHRAHMQEFVYESCMTPQCGCWLTLLQALLSLNKYSEVRALMPRHAVWTHSL